MGSRRQFTGDFNYAYPDREWHDRGFSSMARTEDKTAEDSHDAVVLQAAGAARNILQWYDWHHAGHNKEFARFSNIAEFQACVDVLLEYEFPGEIERFVDIAIFVGHKPLLFVEIKSKYEAQSASGWSRQVRRYARLSEAPCILAVSHKLGDVQREYLRATHTPVLYLPDITCS
jgi:hypothetical protein